MFSEKEITFESITGIKHSIVTDIDKSDEHFIMVRTEIEAENKIMYTRFYPRTFMKWIKKIDLDKEVRKKLNKLALGYLSLQEL
jgi:hypothetical protein